MSAGTRSEVKRFIQSGRVFVNGIPADKPGQAVSMEDHVTLDGEQISFVEYEYYMLNKPAGTVSAVKDTRDTTVVSLITGRKREDLFPVGRLDKDTEGLLLITNDGELAHRLLSPRKHVWKTYLVKVQGKVSQRDIQQLEQGMDIGDEKPTLPARIKCLESQGKEEEDGQEITWLELEIREGRYHQIKRMMAAVDKPVIYLKRISMGDLRLDESLAPGEYRSLTPEEVAGLMGKIRREADSSEL